jgi:hypothetical protein
MTLMWIIATILALLLVGAIVVACAPLVATGRCDYSGDSLSYSFDMWWLHRALLHGHLDNTRNEFAARVLFWHIPLDDKEEPAEEAGDTHDETEGEEGMPAPAIRAELPPREPATVSPAAPQQPRQEHVPDSEEPEVTTDEAGEDPREKRTPLRWYHTAKKRYEEFLGSRVLYVLRQDRLRRKVLRCLAGAAKLLLKLVAFDRLRIAVRASSDNPSTLGVLSGAVTGISQALATRPKHLQAISFEPVFDHDVLDIHASMAAHTSVGRLAAPAVRVLITFPYFTAFIVGFRVWRMGRKKGTVDAGKE